MLAALSARDMSTTSGQEVAYLQYPALLLISPRDQGLFLLCIWDGIAMKTSPRLFHLFGYSTDMTSQGCNEVMEACHFGYARVLTCIHGVSF
jgi:hypothetical protein